MSKTWWDVSRFFLVLNLVATVVFAVAFFTSGVPWFVSVLFLLYAGGMVWMMYDEKRKELK